MTNNSFSNIENTNRVKYLLIRIPLIVVLTILVLQMFEVFTVPYLLIPTAALAILAMISTLLFKMFYVNIELTEAGIVIKYYHLFPLIRAFQKIEIPKGQLSNINHKKSWGGIVSVLDMQVQTKQGIASYPEISLTLFPKPIRENIVNAIVQWR